MRTQIPNGRDRTLGRIADRQYGVVAREQLLAAGLSPQVIGRALRAGRLRPVFRGVYAVGHLALSREGWWMAALLTGGSGSVLSHRSGGMLWRLMHGEVLPVELIAPGDRGRMQAHLVTHRMRLSLDETMVFDGLPVTTPARTIADLAAVLPPRPLRDVVERAQDLGRFNPEEIRGVLHSAPGRPGARPLRDLLVLLQPDRDGARSHLERIFLRLVRQARLPRPLVNEPIGGLARDFVWTGDRLVVEVDGYRYHSSRRAQRRDRRRDRGLIAVGWRPVRFTYEEIAFEPESVVRELSILMGLR